MKERTSCTAGATRATGILRAMALRDHVIWWSGLLALPVLLGQAFHARRKTPLLPSAPAPHSGTWVPEAVSESSAFSVFLVGESTVAGVGARDHEHGLSGQLALQLAERLRRPVRWEALGLNGARALDCLAGPIGLELPHRLNLVAPDLIVVVLGVNDTTKLTKRAEWRSVLPAIVKRLRGSTSCPIFFTGVPPMESFTALPWPLRSVLGARARLLDEDIARLVGEDSNCWHHAIDVELNGEDLAVDGFHPSESGYARWAAELGAWVVSVGRWPSHGE